LEKSDGTVRTYSIGPDNVSTEWYELELPNGIYFTKVIGPAKSTAKCAIDNMNKLWMWDYRGTVSEMMPESASCFENGDSSERPNHFKWFTDKKIKVLDIEGGFKFIVALTEDAKGKREFYGLGNKTREKYDG
jgi:hypothetical protein